jgi:hypothetical protein
MIAISLIAAIAAAWLARQLHALSGTLPRNNDDMIFF